LLEQPDLALDLALDDGLAKLQEAKLPTDLSFKFLQSRQRHGIPRDKILTFLKHPGAKDQRAGPGSRRPGSPKQVFTADRVAALIAF
jgi:hypothetical protein